MSNTGADIRLTDLVHRYTDLSENDLHILLEVSHSLPFIGDLEGGDTYINVLTRDRESLVVAQYRHPDYDLYHRDIVGEIELRENEPAVYRALEQGTPGRGLIGIIDEGRLVVRHTVSSIRNADGRIIGSLTHEFPNARPNTDPVRIITKDGFSTPFEEPFQQSISYHRSRIRELEKELEYQEALVREVHHRVKNNLQTMISLIGLEAAQTKNADVKAFARTITRHIQSVSLTYEMLSRSDSDAVNVKYLLTKLTENLHNYTLTLQPTISIAIEGDNVKLPANLASTVALIVNELLLSLIHILSRKNISKCSATMGYMPNIINRKRSSVNVFLLKNNVSYVLFRTGAIPFFFLLDMTRSVALNVALLCWF